MQYTMLNAELLDGWLGFIKKEYERRVGVLILRVAQEDFFFPLAKKMGKTKGIRG